MGSDGLVPRVSLSAGFGGPAEAADHPNGNGALPQEQVRQRILANTIRIT